VHVYDDSNITIVLVGTSLGRVQKCLRNRENLDEKSLGLSRVQNSVPRLVFFEMSPLE
jgi:hypothetical protein